MDVYATRLAGHIESAFMPWAGGGGDLCQIYLRLGTIVFSLAALKLRMAIKVYNIPPQVTCV